MLSGIFPVAVFLLPAIEPPATPDPEIVRIGIVGSLSQNTSPRLRELFAPELNSLVKDFTGLKSVSLQGLDPFTAARQLQAGKWHLGVFEGVHFAWAQAKYPRLQPLLLAVNQEEPIQAVLAVKKGSEIKSFADLKGKDVDILEWQLPCRLFAEKETGGRPGKYFARLFQSQDGQEALNDVLRGKVKAAIVDAATLSQFKDLYPGRYQMLTMLAHSPPFPPPVVVYYEGSLGAGMLKQFRDGMLKASQSEKGKSALATFRILRFQAVPADFQKTLAKIAKAYPVAE